MIKRILNYAPHIRAYPKIWGPHLLFWLGAIVIALCAILFTTLATFANDLFASIVQSYPYLTFLIIPTGFALTVWLTRRYFPGGEGSGIPQTIAAIDAPELADRASILSLRVAVGKVLLTTLGLLSGASIGREGPTIQIGAAIMHKLGKTVGEAGPFARHALILAGGAAGISAAFNTPLAGILFAIEELSRSFEERTSGMTLTTVIISGVVSVAILGNYTYFGHTNVTLELTEAWKPVLVCGLLGGIMGGFFSRLIITLSNNAPGFLGRFIKNSPVLFAALCGFTLALIGLFCDQTIYGTGYEQARALIEGTKTIPESYGILKMLATVVSYISGLPGGLFAPTLSVGAGFGANIASFMPDVPFAAVAILGMVGYFTGVVQVPITATIIVMEMTDDPALALPLLATAFLSQMISKVICPTPLYRTLALSLLEKTKLDFCRLDEKAERQEDANKK